MSFLHNLFSKRQLADTSSGSEIVFHMGDTVKCSKCGRKVKIGLPRRDVTGKILIASVDDMLPFALRCEKCNYITCASCAIMAYEIHNPREGIPTCPSCGEVSGPIFFAEWLDLK
jgi:hypothetical protein